MKNRYRTLFTVALAALTALTARASSTVVLEGFENGFTTNSQGQTNIEVFPNQQAFAGPNPRGGDVTISIFTAAGAGDPRVTEGTHSAKVVFPYDGFGNDFAINLSDLACSMIENAAISNQPGRYILRYDVILQNPSLVSYFNEHWFVGNNWNYVRSGGGIQTTYNGVIYEKDCYSVAVELPEVGMPTNAPSGTNSGDFNSGTIRGMTGFCSDQFQAVTEPLNNFTIYIDNVRLIDTYATPTTVPAVYPIQSFEGRNNLGGATNLDPAAQTISDYTTNGQYNATTYGSLPGVTAIVLSHYPYYVYSSSIAVGESDFAVTDGTNCLMISNNASGYSYDVISIPLTNSVLQQILNLYLTQDQLAQYTIQWDMTTPYVPVLSNGVDGDYFQLDYNATTGSILPMSTGRRQSDNQFGLQRQTYSATLDQILYWGNPPALAISTSVAANWAGNPFYIDNIRILNTAPKNTVITTQILNGNQFTVTWASQPGQSYTIQYTTNLNAGFHSNLATSVPSGGFTTTKTVTVPNGQAGYVRILTQ